MAKRKGFTLIELLVVVAIIAILAAILVPALSKVREQTRRVVCVANIKQLVVISMLYADDNGGVFPGGRNDGASVFGRAGNDFYTLQGYGLIPQLLYCPSDAARRDLDPTTGWPVFVFAGGIGVPYSILQWGPNYSYVGGYGNMENWGGGDWHGWVSGTFGNPDYPPSYSYTECAADQTQAPLWLDRAWEGPRGLWPYTLRESNHVAPPMVAGDGGTLGLMVQGENIGFVDGHAEWLNWPEVLERNRSLHIYNGLTIYY